MTVAYRLSMPAPHSHLFQVELRIAGGGGGPVELTMPSWTPGSYLLREYPRNVQDFRAEDEGGRALPWSKKDKSRWRVESPGGEVRVSYRVYANELTVRTSHLDASHGYVNGASVFMYVRGREREPLELEVAPPEGWRVTTTLPSPAPLRYRAAHYDELVDSPLEIGTHALLEWEQSGVPHRYAIWGEGSYDGDRLVADTRKIVAAAETLFGGLPYASYTFFLHLFPEGRGGLEHRDSSSLQADRWAFEGEEYENLLALVAHEHFHVWNAKRIRPAPLGPFDYTAENYTTNLWVVEGLTTYYTDLILRRAGIITPERYLARLSDYITRFDAIPGRRHQTLAESSFDTWIRFYRPDEHTPNAQISYYHKGALVGLLLDLEIRGATRNRRSLDDLMRILWERYGAPDVGFPESGEGSVEAIAAEVAGRDLSAFFDRYIRSTDELQYEPYLRIAGLQLVATPEPKAVDPAAAPAAPGIVAAAGAAPTKRPTDGVVLEGRLGIRTRDQGGRLKITTVLSDAAAWRAGLDAGDEILALDGFRVATAAELAKRIWPRKAGETLALTLFRRDELLTLPLQLDPAPGPKARLARVPKPTVAQEAVWTGWMGIRKDAAPPSDAPEIAAQGE